MRTGGRRPGELTERRKTFILKKENASKAGGNDAKVFWSQIGLENEEAETILRQANRQDIVMNRCTKIEYMRLFV